MSDEDSASQESTKTIMIKPPNPVASKVTVGGPGAVDMEAIAKAEAVIAGMSENYLEWVEADLNKIQNACDKLKAASDEKRQELVDPIFKISHDMKGQGGSFDYQLMTILGDGLCRFLEKMEEAGNVEIEVIQLYINTMKLVISQRMNGTGGAEGEKILDGLDMVVAKIIGK